MQGFDYELHWTLSDALRESARHGFDRKLKDLWPRYTLPGWQPSLTLAHACLRETGGGGAENQDIAEIIARYRPDIT